MLKEKRITSVRSDKRNRCYERVSYIYECDGCHIEFERRQCAERELHFHSRECYQSAMKSGPVHDSIVARLTPETFKRKRATMLERYGVVSFTALPHVRAKARQTCMDRYGSNSSMGDPAVRAKKECTFLERYGTTVPIAFHPDTIKKACRSMTCFRTIKHWKTGVELHCRGSYEVAFVEWCNRNHIDFDWQLPFEMPNGRTYIIDAYIKTGEHTDKWIEIKGYMRSKSRPKWDWFHADYPNSELWDKVRLVELGILS